MKIEEHVMSARKTKDGVASLASALQDDPVLLQEARIRLAQYSEMERANRLGACWISRTMKETLTAALAVMNTMPGVPAGG